MKIIYWTRSFFGRKNESFVLILNKSKFLLLHENKYGPGCGPSAVADGKNASDYFNFFILSVKRFFINYAVTLQQNFNLTLVVDICCFPKIILKVMKQSDMETMAKAFTASGW